MKKILLLSDTHSFIDENITKYAIDCDEIWHAGDFGDIEVVAKLQAIKPLIGVFGNIDGQEIRNIYPEINVILVYDDNEYNILNINTWYSTGLRKQLIHRRNVTFHRILIETAILCDILANIPFFRRFIFFIILLF